MTSRSFRPRYVMIGGFLGAGKTTAILRLAEHLDRRGCRVGLITNDQSVGLVDTTLLSTRGFPVEEITGGCFCCRFDSLVDATCRLVEAVAPQVFIAEPVGSCTDLRATVSYPLQRLYGDAFVVAPLSVVVDPVRALRTLGVEPGAAFSGKVEYLYRKQLEEAAILVINKIDVIDPARVAALRTALARECPRARIFEVSARTGRGLDAWFDAMVPTVEGDVQPADSDMAMDYALYGEAEALLGWLNARVRLDASAPFDGNAWLRDMAARLQANLDERGIQIMHLKVTLSPGQECGLAVLNQVRSEQPAELSHELIGLLAGADLLINLRAEGDPALLLAALHGALGDAGAAGVRSHVQQVEHLRPGQPTPTYRLSPA